MIFQKYIFSFIILFYFISNFTKAQFIIPEPPKYISPINDYSHVLTDQQIINFNKKLIYYKKKKSIAIVIAIIDSLNKEDISIITATWGTKWQIGQKRESNGIFILLVKKDKKISIQTGYGIEPYLTDITCKKIINFIRPDFQKDKYYFAINNIINILFQKLENYHYIQQKQEHVNIINMIIYLFIIIIIYIYLYNNHLFLLKEDIIYPTLPRYYNNKNLYHEDENYNDHDFGGGGEFGGGGASGNW